MKKLFIGLLTAVLSVALFTNKTYASNTNYNYLIETETDIDYEAGPSNAFVRLSVDIDVTIKQVEIRNLNKIDIDIETGLSGNVKSQVVIDGQAFKLEDLHIQDDYVFINLDNPVQAKITFLIMPPDGVNNKVQYVDYFLNTVKLYGRMNGNYVPIPPPEIETEIITEDYNIDGNYQLMEIEKYDGKNYIYEFYNYNEQEINVNNSGWVKLPTGNITVSATYDYFANHFEISYTGNDQTYPTGNVNIKLRYLDQYKETPIFSINSLPPTQDKLGLVQFITNDNIVTIEVTYGYETYILPVTLNPATDMTIFDTIEAYYMNVGNKPQIIINHSDRPYLREILESANDEKPAFVPHSIWDLKTNKIKTINEYITYVYIKQQTDGPIVAYVYIDEFIMDKLLSATVKWTDRQKHGWPTNWILGDYTEWETNELTMVADEYLEYRDFTSEWHDAIPIWNAARAIYKLTTYYEMPRIQGINPNMIPEEYNITKSEVEGYFNNMNEDFSEFKSNPRYKLWALALQGGKSYFGTQTEIFNDPENPNDNRNFQIIQLIYETEGKLYQTVGSDISLKITVNEDIDGLANETTFWDEILKFFEDSPALAWTLTVILFIVVVLPIITAVIKNLKKFTRSFR